MLLELPVGRPPGLIGAASTIVVAVQADRSLRLRCDERPDVADVGGDLGQRQPLLPEPDEVVNW